MIEATLEFPYRAGILSSIVENLMCSPTALRPTHYQFGEDEPKRLIDDEDRFISSVTDANPTPILVGPTATYDISVAGEKPIICRCDLDVSPALAKEFLVDIAKIQPTFGYAAAPEETERRNRLVVQLSEGASLESWVGRDTEKYVPGLYWLTLLSDALVRKHRLLLSAVKQVAKSYCEVEAGQHLFRFYETPVEWDTTSEVVKLCTRLNGVFDIEKVRSRLRSRMSFLEARMILDKWR